MQHRSCGRSGLKLPPISLGCWHNFGAPGTDTNHHTDELTLHDNARRMLRDAFDRGIYHFDLANNYGPPPGAAEERVGRILSADFKHHRDELIISTKAGYRMWPGPFGEWGSRKSLLASLDQSLRRLRLDYVDVFYSHRPDPPVEQGGTPIEETMAALDHAVRAGKALYTGISNYSAEQTTAAINACTDNHLTRPVIHQPNYSILRRDPERALLETCRTLGLGVIAFSPLAQGLLTDKYLSNIPTHSRAASVHGFLQRDSITPELTARLNALNQLAQSRNQSLAQMAIAWLLRTPAGATTPLVASALIGVSTPKHIAHNLAALDNPTFTPEELKQI